MRVTRQQLLGEGHEMRTQFLHVVSRIVGKEMLIGREEKEWFREVMRKLSRFSGVEVLSYCLMSNHIHLLLEVPPRPEGEMSEDELLRRMGHLYSDDQMAEVRVFLEEAKSRKYKGEVTQKGLQAIRDFKERYTKRMFDLSFFMKELKMRFTQWYNTRKKRSGTLWESRFKSVLVEGGEALRTVAAYIDLNPVRAGIVSDPKDYRWSGYGEAVAGGREAQAGLRKMMEKTGTPYQQDRQYGEQHSEGANDSAAWEMLREYRLLLAADGEEVTEDMVMQPGQSYRQREKKSMGLSKKQVEKIIASGGKLTRAEMLRCRIRYFSDGAVLGSREFVDRVFSRMQRGGAVSEKRVDGARKMRGVSVPGIFSLRDLRKDAVEGSS